MINIAVIFRRSIDSYQIKILCKKKENHVLEDDGKEDCVKI